MKVMSVYDKMKAIASIVYFVWILFDIILNIYIYIYIYIYS